MGVADDGSRTPGNHRLRIFGRDHHTAFHVDMGVYESRAEEFSPQIHLPFRLIVTNTNDGIPIYGHIRGIDFPG